MALEGLYVERYLRPHLTAPTEAQKYNGPSDIGSCCHQIDVTMLVSESWSYGDSIGQKRRG